MKLTLALIALARASDYEDDILPDDVWSTDRQVAEGQVARSGTRGLDDERRYIDLHDIAKKIWKKAGYEGKNRFDERKYWAYGCHCFLLGDRPMSEMGKGSPVDALDVRCKAYKDCQKCVRAKHGDSCIGELVKYGWRYRSKSKDFECQQQQNTCENDLFQCDLKLAQDTFAMKDTFNTDYHAFWSTLPNGFDNREDSNCPINGGIPVEHDCCGGNGNPYWWMNKNTHTCIANKPVEN
jgi:hypothetical protein